MLFITTYTPRARASEAEEKRVLQLFANWKPAAGHDIKGWWATPSGLGVQVSEADSVAAIMESISPWGVYFEFKVEPAAEIGQVAEALGKAVAWRESVK
jgi:hypothetical protein